MQVLQPAQMVPTLLVHQQCHLLHSVPRHLLPQVPADLATRLITQLPQSPQLQALDPLIPQTQQQAPQLGLQLHQAAACPLVPTKHLPGRLCRQLMLWQWPLPAQRQVAIQQLWHLLPQPFLDAQCLQQQGQLVTLQVGFR